MTQLVVRNVSQWPQIGWSNGTRADAAMSTLSIDVRWPTRRVREQPTERTARIGAPVLLGSAGRHTPCSRPANA